MLIVYGILFLIIENRNKNRKEKITDFTDLSYKTVLFIGLFQALSLIPRTSRSGVTILGALLLGLSRHVAAEYSFFMSIPIMFGASFVSSLNLGFDFTGLEITILLSGMIVALVVSLIAIKFLMRYIRNHDFKAFGWYRIVLGVVVLSYFVFIK